MGEAPNATGRAARALRPLCSPCPLCSPWLIDVAIIRPEMPRKKESSKTRLRAFRIHPETEATQVKPGANGDGAPGAARAIEPQQRRKYMRDYARWLWPYRWALAGVFVIAVITTGLNMVWPLLIKRVIDLLPADLPADAKMRRLNMMGASIVTI